MVCAVGAPVDVVHVSVFAAPQAATRKSEQ
jgi:hypothetical protein